MEAVPVNTTPGRDDEGSLVEAWVGLMAQLRGHPHGSFPGGPGADLYGGADRFVTRLAAHLRYTEEVLFPALRESEPGSAHEIEGLRQDHRILHHLVRDFAPQIQGGVTEGAYGDARSFLAVLLDHLRCEAAAAGGGGSLLPSTGACL